MMTFNIAVLTTVWRNMILKTIRVDREKRELTQHEKEKRWEVNLCNAKETMELLNKEKYNSLHVIGVVQGWDSESYCECAKELLEMGYDYLGIGGIARRPSSQLKKIVVGINKEVDKLPAKKRGKPVKESTPGFGMPH